MLWVALIGSVLYVAFISFVELSWYTADYVGYCINESQSPSSPDCDLFYPIYLPDLIVRNCRCSNICLSFVLLE